MGIAIFFLAISGAVSAAVAAVQMDDTGPGIIAAHGHHIHIRGSGDFDGNQGSRIKLP